MGVHQRIDRLARRSLMRHLPAHTVFPTSKEILHFEGLNGPDGIKRKSPSADEPWHHIDPNNPQDRGLITLIHDHIYNLSVALSDNNQSRAAFEAAWLAHAVTDGLTPAHHDNLAEKIEELWGKAHHERDSVRDKALIRGDNHLDTIRKNWRYWGAGGVFTAHFMFEWGVATALASNKYPASMGASRADIIHLKEVGFETVFYESLHNVTSMKMYESFGEKGWTHELAQQTTQQLVPEIVRVVTLAWYQALVQTESAHAS